MKNKRNLKFKKQVKPEFYSLISGTQIISALRMTVEKSQRIAKIMWRSRTRMDSSKANKKSSRYQRVSGEKKRLGRTLKNKIF